MADLAKISAVSGIGAALANQHRVIQSTSTVQHLLTSGVGHWAKLANAQKSWMTMAELASQTAINGNWIKTLSNAVEANKRIYDNMSLIRSTFPDPAISKAILSWQTALQGWGNQYTRSVIEEEDETLAEDFKTLAVVAEEVTMALKEDPANTQKIGEIIGRLLARLYAVTKNDIKKTGYIGMIGFLLALWTQFDPEAIHKKDFIELQQQVKFQNNNKSEDKIESTVLQKAVLRLRPAGNSQIVDSLQVGQVVKVVQVNHKWAQITITDKDTFPRTGWMIKKYLTKGRNDSH